MIAYYDVEKDQLFISSLDTVILSILMFVFVICETQKSETFFEEPKNNLQDAISYLEGSKILPEQSFYMNNRSSHSPMIRKTSYSSVDHFQEGNKVKRVEAMDAVQQDPLVDSEDDFYTANVAKKAKLRSIKEE
jgi:hypothetical protein